MMNSISKNGLLLAGFALVATFLILVTDRFTRDTIEQQQSAQVLSLINELISPDSYDNNIILDCTTADGFETSLEFSKVYRARVTGQPIALIFEAIAPNGYNGNIHMLIGTDISGSITGVRVIEHKETPGLGDKIDLRISDWILGFNNQSLSNDGQSRWKVKKDGGQFDQFTGATITPRAVVQTVFDTLVFSEENLNTLFEAEQSCPK